MTSNSRQPVARLISSTAFVDPLRASAPVPSATDGHTAAEAPRRVPFTLRSAGPNRPRWLPYAVVADRVRPSYIGFSDAESLARFLKIRATIPG